MQNFFREQTLRGEGVQALHQDGSLPLLYFFKQTLQMQLSQELLKYSYLKNLFEGTDNKPDRKQTYAEEKEETTNSAQKVLSRNETKNIPKNFGKAIISFVESRPEKVRKLLVSENITYEQYVSQLKSRKKELNSIADLRSLWLDGEFRFGKVTRVLSLHFLKKGSLKYIFNSRINNFKGHVKYRNRLMEFLKNPEEFTCMKTSNQ